MLLIALTGGNKTAIDLCPYMLLLGGVNTAIYQRYCLLAEGGGGHTAIYQRYCLLAEGGTTQPVTNDIVCWRRGASTQHFTHDTVCWRRAGSIIVRKSTLLHFITRCLPRIPCAV